MNTNIRELESVITGLPTTDGDGVNLIRIIGTPELQMLDPFLLFDVFESDHAEDYIGGFPSHPHRGFETITYLLAGRMRHQDSQGHNGVIEAGGVQWMVAGKGIVHSEMPEQENGLLQGTQLWINLPASKKMQAPSYQDFSTDDIVVEHLDGDTEIRIIAGITKSGLSGPITDHPVKPTYMDVLLPEGQVFEQILTADDNAFIFIIKGELSIGSSMEKLSHRQMGVLKLGETVRIIANKDSQFLLVAGQPIRETVVRGGSFVMNTKAEIRQAFEDFENKLF